MKLDDVIRLAKIADPGFGDGPESDGTMADSLVGVSTIMRFARLVEMVTHLERFNIENYTINDDLTVDVAGNVIMDGSNLKSMPVIFGKVGGDFNCSSNQLTSLEGAPREIGGDFNCVDNELTSLKGSPREVGGDFWCLGNRLSSFDVIGNVDGEIHSGLL